MKNYWESFTVVYHECLVTIIVIVSFGRIILAMEYKCWLYSYYQLRISWLRTSVAFSE